MERLFKRACPWCRSRWVPRTPKPLRCPRCSRPLPALKRERSVKVVGGGDASAAPLDVEEGVPVDAA